MRNTDIFNSTPLDTQSRLHLLYGNALGGLAITALCMAVLCFGFNTPERQSATTSVFLALLFVHMLRLADNLYTTAQFNSSNFNVKAAVWRFSAGIVMNSVIWACYSFMFVPAMQNIEITVSAVILSSLAGGAVTILAASRVLSILYMSSLILPYAAMGFISEVSYFHYISFLGISFWAVMMLSSAQAGKFVAETLLLKNENSTLLALMNIEKTEVENVNNQLVTANKQLDSYNLSLAAEVEKRTEEIFRLSNLDPLTHLMNRNAFLRNLKKTLQNPANASANYAVLFIDLDGFKDVNDGFGHKVGDAVLGEIAKRLQAIEDAFDLESKTETLLCRWGGDEFLVCAGYSAESALKNLAQDIVNTISSPIQIASNNITLGASIGIAKYPSDSLDPHALIQYADISMYQQKKNSKGEATHFSPALFDVFQYNQVIRDGLKNALLNNEFSLVYQPIVDIQEQQTWAIEALLRWRHNGQPISPVEFIPIAEKSGRIIEIGAWVLKHACQEAATWTFKSKPAVSVNVSSLQLLDSRFIAVIDEVLLQSGLPADRLHLEITESVMLENGELAQIQLKAIADRGIRVSIDDFGTGFSSLNKLQTMSFDTIKIDRSFLQGLNTKDRTIIAATKLIADEFGAKTVAEGIETQAELVVLEGLGIRYIQGYLFAKPMQSGELNHWINTFTQSTEQYSDEHG